MTVSNKAMSIWLQLSLVLFLASTIQAQQVENRYRETVSLSANGDAISERRLSVSRPEFLQLRSAFSSAQAAAQNFIDTTTWREQSLLSARFDDSSAALMIFLETKGLARSTGDQLWLLENEAGFGGATLITSNDERLVLHRVRETSLGLVSETLKIVLPPGATDVNFDQSRGRLSYRCRPSAAPTTTQQPMRFTLEAQPTLMAALANLYSNPQFKSHFVGRSVFHNSTDETFRDYRIRFRISNLSPWSPWQKSARVYPGQTVVDPFFPILDLDEIRSLTGRQTCQIETEYEYVTADGSLVQEQATQSIEVLPRDKVRIAQRNGIDAWTAYQQQLPEVAACFRSSNDPAIQQLAGHIAQMSGGAAASADKTQASRYLISTWEFLSCNNIQCVSKATPPADPSTPFKIRQGRDVLQDQKGSTLDLSLLLSSISKAVGLPSHLVVIPEQTIVVIQTPDGDTLPIDTTLVGKEDLQTAVNSGIELVNKTPEHQQLIIELDTLEESGVRGLDLGAFSSDFFRSAGFKFPEMFGEETETTTEQEQTTQDYRDEPVEERTMDQRLIGAWHATFDYEGNRFHIAVRFDEKGRYAEAVRLLQNGSVVNETIERGTYRVSEQTIYLTNDDDELFVEDYKFDKDGDVWIYSPALELEVEFHRGR